jgi:hypothetical protein
MIDDDRAALDTTVMVRLIGCKPTYQGEKLIEAWFPSDPTNPTIMLTLGMGRCGRTTIAMDFEQAKVMASELASIVTAYAARETHGG